MKQGTVIVSALTSVLVAGLFSASQAVAASPDLLWQAPEDGMMGSAAGQLRSPAGAATDAAGGHVFVADSGNRRIDEFDVWGQFVKAWGWGVEDGSAEPQVCTTASGCQAGIPGAGVGQVTSPSGLVVDPEGNVYAYEPVSNISAFGERSFRVQKFDSEGQFVLMFGGEVDKTTKADICTKADLEGGDVCGAGVPGNGDGQFGEAGELTPNGNGIAIGPEGNIFVADGARIQRFSPSGVFEAKIEVPGERLANLAIDSVGNFYVTYAEGIARPKEKVKVLSPSGSLLKELQVARPRGLALDAADNLYAVEGSVGPGDRVVEFDSSGVQLIGSGEHLGEAEAIGGLAIGVACGIPGGDLYVSRNFPGPSLQAYGPPPDTEACPPPAAPPSILDQFAASVDPEDAVLRARINPHFWPDTRYHVEFGTGKCSEGGCDREQPTGGGALLSSQVVNAPLLTGGVFLNGLSPGTTYHYRFVAGSSGGGPTIGAEATFRTFPLPAKPPGGCPNGAFRTGFSAVLPDCRAYEMVSPVDKENGDIVTSGEGTRLFQSSVDGGGFAYSSYRAFGDAESGSYNSEYLAQRGGEGWGSHAVTPPRGENLLGSLATLLPQFKLFSPDLCEAWVSNDTDSVLAPGMVPGFASLLRRHNCGAEADTYTPLAPLEGAAPKYRVPHDFLPMVQGVSADGAHTVFRVADRLTDSGPDLGKEEPLVYDAFGSGKLKLVCVLPNGNVVSSGCSLGTPGGGVDDGRNQSVHNAVSADGSHIFWSDVHRTLGRLYVRINGKGPTVQITTEPAQFWTAAADGSKAVYSLRTGGVGPATLYEFDVAQKTTKAIAGEVAGVLGASEDASRIYLASEEALAAGGEAGKVNLYLYESGEGGKFTFIGELSDVDAKQTAVEPLYSPLDTEPDRHVARVSADGGVAVFDSTSRALSEAVAGYDNTDQVSGEGDAEVYRYDAGEGRLVCVSCNPTGARPIGRILTSIGFTSPVAGLVQPAENQLYAPKVLSLNGRRIFFESFEPLAPGDTNGREDVYQWEAAGEGTCTEAGSSFNPESGGCVDLISSGEDPNDSSLLDASADGSDAFISTGASLLPQDTGLIDAYDARVDGGFAPEPTPAQPCEGEACQSPPPAPSVTRPSSSTYRGPGNESRCRKGTHRVHGRCVKRHRRKRAARHGRGGKR